MNPPATEKPPAFRHPHRVVYADCTLGNHIYYARYLHLLEAARGEYFRSLGKTFAAWQEDGFIFPVIEVQLRYKSPARYDELLQIEVTPIRAEGIRLTFGYRVLGQDGTLKVEGETQHVCASLHEKPRRLPQELRVALGH
jgi:acyl-CoA thioester hydrolase